MPSTIIKISSSKMSKESQIVDIDKLIMKVISETPAPHYFLIILFQCTCYVIALNAFKIPKQTFIKFSASKSVNTAICK